MDKREQDEVDGQMIEAAARGYRLANMEQENSGNRHVYQFNRLHFNLALIGQFVVWAIGIYASFVLVQQRVDNLEKQATAFQAQSTAFQAGQVILLEKLNRIEVDIMWLKDAQKDQQRYYKGR